MDGVVDRKTMKSERKVSRVEVVLRVLGLVLTLVAAIVLGVDKQSKVVPIKLIATLPPLNIQVPAKWHYLSAFVYHVVTNAIACAYAALSLVLLLVNKGGKSTGLVMLTIVLDLTMVALLFSSTGATAAVGVIGYKGNSHVQWKKVCNVFGRFCAQVAVSVVFSLLGSLAFFLLVAFAATRSLKKTN